MAKKHKPEEIVAKLRQVDVLTSQGTPIADAVRSIGVTEVTYYRWRQEFGGLYQSAYPLTGLAQERWVREAMRSGMSMSLFQASRHASRTAS